MAVAPSAVVPEENCLPGVGGGSVGGSGSRAGGESSSVRTQSAVTKTAASPTLHNLLVPATGMLLVSSIITFARSEKSSFVAQLEAQRRRSVLFFVPPSLYFAKPFCERRPPITHFSRECIADVDTTGQCCRALRSFRAYDSSVTRTRPFHRSAARARTLSPFYPSAFFSPLRLCRTNLSFTRGDAIQPRYANELVVGNYSSRCLLGGTNSLRIRFLSSPGLISSGSTCRSPSARVLAMYRTGRSALVT